MNLARIRKTSDKFFEHLWTSTYIDTIVQYVYLIFALAYDVVLCLVGTTNPHGISEWLSLMMTTVAVAKGMCMFVDQKAWFNAKHFKSLCSA